MDDFSLYPYKPFTSPEKEPIYRTMRVGNKALVRVAELLSLERKEVRGLLFGKRLNLQNFPHLTPAEIIEIEQAIPLVFAVNNLQDRVMCAFSEMVKDRAFLWAKKLSCGGNFKDHFQDCVQEGYLALMDAIFGYTEESADFFTYAHTSVHNRLSTYFCANSRFFKLPHDAVVLLAKFEEAKSKFNDRVTDDEIIQRMGCNEDEIKVLLNARQMVLQGSYVCKTNREINGSNRETSAVGDYTAYRKGVDSEENFEMHEMEIEDSTRVAEEAVKRANLSEMETAALRSYSDPHWGWQEELASQHINPNTGKRYTRQAIGIILEAALKKVRRAYFGNKKSCGIGGFFH
jgi:DNA-directed RNA polymerase specialized sigma subunit